MHYTTTIKYMGKYINEIAILAGSAATNCICSHVLYNYIGSKK